MDTFNFTSQDGITVITSNPFENARYYLDNFSKEKFEDLEAEKQTSLYYDLNQIKFRIIDFADFDLLNSETAEAYTRTAKEFIKFLISLKNIVNIDDYGELLDFYKSENFTDSKQPVLSTSEFKKEMQKFEKELLAKSSTIGQMKNKKPTKEETFDLYFKIALAICENMIRPKNGINVKQDECTNFATESELFKEFILKGTHTAGTIGQYIFKSIVTINKDKSLYKYGRFEEIYDRLSEHYGKIHNIPHKDTLERIIARKKNLDNLRQEAHKKYNF